MTKSRSATPKFRAPAPARAREGRPFWGGPSLKGSMKKCLPWLNMTLFWSVLKETMQNFRGVVRLFFFFLKRGARTAPPGVPQLALPAGGGGGGEERGRGPRRRGEGGVGERRALGLSGKPRAARGARARARVSARQRRRHRCAPPGAPAGALARRSGYAGGPVVGRVGRLRGGRRRRGAAGGGARSARRPLHVRQASSVPCSSSAGWAAAWPLARRLAQAPAARSRRSR